ncbi:D-alanyl-D-alanine carboxypeptidase family protein, partial [Patescibacteria group bacterium]
LKKAEDLVKGTGARVFAKLITAKGAKNIDYGYKFKQKDKIKINFYKNEDAEDHYGMKTLFKHQPEIKQVKIKQFSARGKGRNGLATRRGLNGNFYFADGSYAPIFHDTEVEVVKVLTAQELAKYKKTASSYKFGKSTRRISKQDQTFYRKKYGFVPPNPKDKKAVNEYWNLIDNSYDKGKRLKAARTVPRGKFVPKNQLEKQFYKQWDKIMKITDRLYLWNLRDTILFRANDPIVKVPGERRGMRLRSAAALRWALFKRYAELSGYKVYITSAHRSTARQKKLWFWGLSKRMRMMRQKYPNASEAYIKKLATALNARYVARPGKSHHNTGGAVDIAIWKGKKRITMHKFSQYKKRHAKALAGNLKGLSSKDKKAIRARQFLDKTLQASHFLGTNYHAETWHWNIDKDSTTGKKVYRNV